MGKTYTQLSIEDRAMIQTQLSMGLKPSQIARELGRLPGTLSRELKRNGWSSPKLPRGVGRPLVAGGCRAVAAQQGASACAASGSKAARTGAKGEHTLSLREFHANGHGSVAAPLGREFRVKLGQWARLLWAGAANIAVNCLLSVCAACFAGNAAAGGMNSGLGAINGSVGAVLKKAGLGSDVPASVKHDARPVARTMKRAGANAGQTVAPVVSGLIVRFASPEARHYARENGSPPQALIDEMNALAGTPLIFFARWLWMVSCSGLPVQQDGKKRKRLPAVSSSRPVLRESSWICGRAVRWHLMIPTLRCNGI